MQELLNSQECPNLSSMSKLFKLKYKDEVTNSLVLAKELQLSRLESFQLECDLEDWLLKKLAVIDSETLSQVCPECLQPSLFVDTQETVCKKCGYVVESRFDIEEINEDKPYGDPWVPSVDSSVGKNLGGTFPSSINGPDKYNNGMQVILKDNCRVKTRGLAEFQRTHPSLAEELVSGKPIVFDDACAYRLRHDKNGLGLVVSAPSKEFLSSINFVFDTLYTRAGKMAKAFSGEDSKMCELLKSAIQRENALGLIGDKVFVATVGTNIRRSFTLKKKYKLSINSKEIVDTVIYLTLEQFKRTAYCLKFKGVLQVNEGFLTCLWQLDDIVDNLMMKQKLNS